jgi:hypothetical protein
MSRLIRDNIRLLLDPFLKGRRDGHLRGGHDLMGSLDAA